MIVVFVVNTGLEKKCFVFGSKTAVYNPESFWHPPNPEPKLLNYVRFPRYSIYLIIKPQSFKKAYFMHF